MTLAVGTQLLYLVISIALTLWVARTLHRNGRVFLVDCFHGNTQLADSINHLLVVGFYLVNIGCVAVSVRFSVDGTSLQTALESLSTKVGLVLLILGAMHFINLRGFTVWRRAALHRAQNPTPPAALSPATPPPAMPEVRMKNV